MTKRRKQGRLSSLPRKAKRAPANGAKADDGKKRRKITSEEALEIQIMALREELMGKNATINTLQAQLAAAHQQVAAFRDADTKRSNGEYRAANEDTVARLGLPKTNFMLNRDDDTGEHSVIWEEPQEAAEPPEDDKHTALMARLEELEARLADEEDEDELEEDEAAVVADETETE